MSQSIEVQITNTKPDIAEASNKNKTKKKLHKCTQRHVQMIRAFAHTRLQDGRVIATANY